MASPDTSRQVAADIANAIPPNDPLVGSYSIQYDNPTKELEIIRTQRTRPPVFQVVAGDPIMAAISNAMADTNSEANQAVSGGRARVPFISAAYKHSPAGFLRTRKDPPSYEQDLCKRSNLLQTLTTFRPGEQRARGYPMSDTSVILSNDVVVRLGPGDEYEPLESPHHLPVVSVTPVRSPSVKGKCTTYSDEQVKNMMREKIRGALLVCLYHKYNRVVIGNFGLDSIYRNPPQGLAELWRDLLLFDPILRGQFASVVFAFEDPTRSTSQFYFDMQQRYAENKRTQRSRMLAAERTSSISTSTNTTAEGSQCHSEPPTPTDMAVFQSVFHPDEIERVLQTPDPRCSIAMVLS
ncbi:hypothetical protein E4U57_001575 [Claviceps arundinis]|uniref:Microbial-type PARG catalytic domain-containing protein n=1 Tax=Claviceps arundinis TaxID=1623583 RepID=A0ABQ7PAU8_9HYPO|nr:hypothetical protein E4U57_001575 [Claviceps arundinis]